MLTVPDSGAGKPRINGMKTKHSLHEELRPIRRPGIHHRGGLQSELIGHKQLPRVLISQREKYLGAPDLKLVSDGRCSVVGRRVWSQAWKVLTFNC